MKKSICIIIVIFISSLPVYATTTVIDFDELYLGVQTSDFLPTGYSEFDWSDNTMWVTSQLPSVLGSGFEYGTVGDASIVTGAGNAISMASSTPFSFLSANITSAWNTDHAFTIEGWLAGTLIHTSSGTTSYDKAYKFDFVFEGIDELRFIPGTGTDVPGGGAGNHLVIDNITVITPEPCSLLLLGLGGLVLRKRKG